MVVLRQSVKHLNSVFQERVNTAGNQEAIRERIRIGWYRLAHWLGKEFQTSVISQKIVNACTFATREPASACVAFAFRLQFLHSYRVVRRRNRNRRKSGSPATSVDWTWSSISWISSCSSSREILSSSMTKVIWSILIPILGVGLLYPTLL